MYKPRKSKKLKAEEVQEIYNSHGEKLTLEDATKILSEANKFCKLVVNQLLKS
ncbi:hypothetical protein FHS59_000124 [Algoriphagus iocasae]|uniref:Uncharacterized protein n=1 Tax=Algoriphagus iocasae TaxID=1836499 RepID=A0A841MGP9_9BACT|nr:hypothetical protein [Algoriphagus iocasae]